MQKGPPAPAFSIADGYANHRADSLKICHMYAVALGKLSKYHDILTNQRSYMTKNMFLKRMCLFG